MTQSTQQQPTTPPRVALVTGASAGIGAATAVEIAARGMAVVATYHSHPEGAEQTVARIAERGGRAVALPLDVGRAETFDAFAADLARALERWGADRLHALVNNAGIGGGRPFVDITPDELDACYRVLLRGPYLLTRTLLPLLADGAAVVSTSSSSVRQGDTQPGYSAYAAMKAGLVVATRYLAAELGTRGIRVNTVAPGPTRTRIADDAFERHPEVVEGIAARTTLGRVGEPEDVARVIAFLASDDAAWVTGQDVLVAGGWAL
jgi:NAD(P)-dependent dehydrogenase (short-subunit alcohol dehydrogenase family)